MKTYEKCSKCRGTGQIPSHLENGKCFSCNGTGKHYPKKHYPKQNKERLNHFQSLVNEEYKKYKAINEKADKGRKFIEEFATKAANGNISENDRQYMKELNTIFKQEKEHLKEIERLQNVVDFENNLKKG